MGDRVLILGGGIAGFGMARALELRGMSCSLVDRLAEGPAGGLGLNLPGNALRALDTLGIADQVVERGRRVRRREYRNASGKLLCAVDEDEFWGAFAPVCLRRGDLLEILRAATSAVDTRWGTVVTEVRSGPAVVEVELESGATESYDFVVGADGVNSTARRAIGEDATTRPSLMSGSSWRFMAPNPGVDCWTVWLDTRGTALMIPVDEEEVYVYASASRGGSAESPSWLSEVFARFAEPVGSVISAAVANRKKLYNSPIEEVRCERWSTERMTLIGDAAHAMGPVWAQGAALALEDALVLAELLAGDGAWTSVGAELERRRKPCVAHVQAATDRLARFARLPNPIRDLILPFAGPKSYRATYGPLRDPASGG